jgi:penicillin-binding protein 1C
LTASFAGGVRWAARGASAALALAAAGAAAFVAWPLPTGLLDRRPVTSVRFTDREGGLLRELRSREDGRSVPLPNGAIPPLVRAAFVATEDRRFGRHPGVDPLAIGRAAWRNLRAGRVTGGASTIPQQLARRLVPRERTLAGKVREALWALRLSAHLDDERLLVEYLDRVPLGHSIHGVEAAAETYFGRPAARLSAGQAALLAGLARSPLASDPYRRPDRAAARMRQVLDAMVATGALSPAETRLAAEAPLDLVPREVAFRAPHLVEALARTLDAAGLGAATTLETTLDPALQAEVEAAMREELSGLAEREATAAAAIVVDNATGEVLAYVGSPDFLDEAGGGQNDGVRALRQPGSALKPFAYGLALASGFTPASVLSDVETHLATPGGDWVPKNYDRRVHGPVRLRAALASSYNVPAVRLADALGPGRILATLRRAGFESLSLEADHYGAGLVLGNGDVSLYELARAYRGLARGGVVGPLATVRRAWDASGAALAPARELEARRFLPAEATALLVDVLSDEAARAPAFGLDNALRLPFPVAAKTGTSRATWTTGPRASPASARWRRGSATSTAGRCAGSPGSPAPARCSAGRCSWPCGGSRRRRWWTGAASRRWRSARCPATAPGRRARPRWRSASCPARPRSTRARCTGRSARRRSGPSWRPGPGRRGSPTGPPAARRRCSGSPATATSTRSTRGSPTTPSRSRCGRWPGPAWTRWRCASTAGRGSRCRRRSPVGCRRGRGRTGSSCTSGARPGRRRRRASGCTVGERGVHRG